ncbi:hypothetical protein [Paenibacillus cookii]|uniref:Uncharacterized protein n=1 Tax=Paenibacillus cookii TaxID=157839 RepID=A0ABQ4LVM0_9BACL|nr:hypothetical protein [Paenibacillus cookii]GIO67327.1 hypothetical protein J21TS3_21480 [Paenibacillus cookii]
MKIKQVLTLRHILILLCIAMLVLIAFKGIDMKRKMAWVDEAERYYRENNLIQAEEWYRKAANNRSFHYKEALIAKRLNELAPVTEMKATLARLDGRVERTGSSQDFAGFLQVYGEFQDARNKFMSADKRFAAVYPKISAGYGISDDITRYFKEFKGLFYGQLEQQLNQGLTDEAGAKWNLQAIPEAFYGGADEKTKQLGAKFKDFDEKLMSRLAGGGKFAQLLDYSQTLMDEYEGRKIQAPWVKSKTEELSRMILKKDVDGDQPANYALHAKTYESYVQSAGIKSSLLKEIDRQIRKWLTSAQRKIKNNDYEGAIALYEALSAYRDTSDEVKKARLAWTAHDPLRLLQLVGQTANFSHVGGGGSRFGGSAYAIGSDDGNAIYFAVMNADETVQAASTPEFPGDVAIRNVSVEESLSTKTAPVLLVEGESASRKALYAAYEVHGSQMTPLFFFEADGYAVQPDRSLLVTNPAGFGEDGSASASQEAVYTRQGDSYQFAGFQKDYADIDGADLLAHENEKVSFACYIVYGGEGQALAQVGASYIKLRGDYMFNEGTSITVVGMFNQFEDVIPGGDPLNQPINVPVFDVERVE